MSKSALRGSHLGKLVDEVSHVYKGPHDEAYVCGVHAKDWVHINEHCGVTEWLGTFHP